MDDDDKREPGEGRSKVAEETRDRPVRPRAVDRDARREAPNPDRLANVFPARRIAPVRPIFPRTRRARARACRRDRRRADARRAANAERATRSRDRDRAEAPKTARPAPRPRLPSAPGVRSPPAPRANPAVDSRGEALWLRYFPRDSLFAQPMANPDGTNRPPAGLFPLDRGWPARRTKYFSASADRMRPAGAAFSFSQSRGRRPAPIDPLPSFAHPPQPPLSFRAYRSTRSRPLAPVRSKRRTTSPPTTRTRARRPRHPSRRTRDPPRAQTRPSRNRNRAPPRRSSPSPAARRGARSSFASTARSSRGFARRRRGARRWWGA